MIRARDIQRFAKFEATFRRSHGLKHLRVVARDHDLPWAIQVGNFDIELIAKSLHILRCTTNHGSHAAFSRIARKLH